MNKYILIIYIVEFMIKQCRINMNKNKIVFLTFLIFHSQVFENYLIKFIIIVDNQIQIRIHYFISLSII